MVVSLLAAGLLLAAAPPVPFTDCELGQRFGPTAVTFAPCNDEADVCECPKAEGGGACTDALCKSAAAAATAGSAPPPAQLELHLRLHRVLGLRLPDRTAATSESSGG